MKRKQEDPIDQAEVAADLPEEPVVPLSESVELVEPPEEAIRRLEEALEQTKDQLLRTAAEFDNFRKRTEKERQGMRASG